MSPIGRELDNVQLRIAWHVREIYLLAEPFFTTLCMHSLVPRHAAQPEMGDFPYNLSFVSFVRVLSKEYDSVRAL